MDPTIPAPIGALTSAELTKLCRQGRVQRLRRGAYLPIDPSIDDRSRHLALVRATLRYVASEAVISHASAAVLHDLPVWGRHLDRVHLTRDRSNGGRKLSFLHVRVAPIDPWETALVDGIRVTGLPRTVIDCARWLPERQAVALGDVALARGMEHRDVVRALARAKGRPGILRARRVIDFLDTRSESPGESHSRVILAGLGLRPSHLQYVVRDEAGSTVGRTDFCWEEHRTLGEFDGKIKYGELRGEADPGDVVFREKVREDRLRDLGWQVVRWTWADLEHPHQLSRRIRNAFDRHRARS